MFLARYKIYKTILERGAAKPFSYGYCFSYLYYRGFVMYNIMLRRTPTALIAMNHLNIFRFLSHSGGAPARLGCRAGGTNLNIYSLLINVPTLLHLKRWLGGRYINNYTSFVIKYYLYLLFSSLNIYISLRFKNKIIESPSDILISRLYFIRRLPLRQLLIRSNLWEFFVTNLIYSLKLMEPQILSRSLEHILIQLKLRQQKYFIFILQLFFNFYRSILLKAYKLSGIQISFRGKIARRGIGRKSALVISTGSYSPHNYGGLTRAAYGRAFLGGGAVGINTLFAFRLNVK